MSEPRTTAASIRSAWVRAGIWRIESMLRAMKMALNSPVPPRKKTFACDLLSMAPPHSMMASSCPEEYAGITPTALTCIKGPAALGTQFDRFVGTGLGDESAGGPRKGSVQFRLLPAGARVDL